MPMLFRGGSLVYLVYLLKYNISYVYLFIYTFYKYTYKYTRKLVFLFAETCSSFPDFKKVGTMYMVSEIIRKAPLIEAF